MRRTHERIPRNRGCHRGTALIEAGLALLLFTGLFLGIVEFSRAFMVTQALVIGAREGARFASVQAGLVTDDIAVTKRVNDWLKSAGVTGSKIKIKTKLTGDLVTVTVSVPYDALVKGSICFPGKSGTACFSGLNGRVLHGSSVMRYEAS